MDSDKPALALITGGDGDLASALSSALGAAGYSVHAPGRDVLDVTSAPSVARYFRESLPDTPDLLVLCAGLIRDASISRMGEEDWDTVLRVNLRGSFLCAREAFRGMLRRCSGHIVGIGSHSALSGPVGQANYAASKAGLIGLIQSLAREGGSRGVRANCVLPGFLETRMTRDLPQEVVRSTLGAHVLDRFNTPPEAARFIVFLDSMPHVSGQVFQLDSRVGRWT